MDPEIETGYTGLSMMDPNKDPAARRFSSAILPALHIPLGDAGIILSILSKALWSPLSLHRC